MRVLHIFNEIDFSGAERMYANAAALFRERDIHMVALSTGKAAGNFAGHFREAGIEVLHLPFRRRSINPVYLWKYLRGICWLIRGKGIDVIHIHRSNVFWYFSCCAWLSRKRPVMTLHNVFRAKKATWILHYLARLTARKWFGLTFQSIGRSVHDNELFYFKNPTVLINNWYDPDRFYPVASRWEKATLRNKIGIPGDAFVVIAVGRCTRIKNHADVLKAVGELRQFPHLVLVHLGKGCLEEAEMRLSHELGIAGQVRFLGNRTDVRDCLVASDLYVMTSRTEGAPIAAIEAMACGLPVALYDNPGMRDLVRDIDNGFLIEPDHYSLAMSILRFLQDPACKEKGASARSYARRHHFRESCVNKIIGLYKNEPGCPTRD